MKRYNDLIDDALARVREILAWDFDDTLPALASDRAQAIVWVCRSGKRSVLATDTLQQMGYSDVVSLKTGIRGWNDFEQPLVDQAGFAQDTDVLEDWLPARVRPDQMRPR